MRSYNKYMTKYKKIIIYTIAALGVAFTANSCTEFTYSYSTGVGYTSKASGSTVQLNAIRTSTANSCTEYAYSTGVGYTSKASGSTVQLNVIRTSSSYWLYNPYRRSYFDTRCGLYYNPLTRSYYQKGATPRMHSTPIYPAGYRRGHKLILPSTLKGAYYSHSKRHIEYYPSRSSKSTHHGSTHHGSTHRGSTHRGSTHHESTHRGSRR